MKPAVDTSRCVFFLFVQAILSHRPAPSIPNCLQGQQERPSYSINVHVYILSLRFVLDTHYGMKIIQSSQGINKCVDQRYFPLDRLLTLFGFIELDRSCYEYTVPRNLRSSQECMLLPDRKFNLLASSPWYHPLILCLGASYLPWVWHMYGCRGTDLEEITSCADRKV